MSAILNEGLIKQLVQRFFMMRRAGEKTSVILHALLHETYAQGVAAANRAAAAAAAGRLAQQVASPLSRPCSTVLTPLDLWQARNLMAAAHDAMSDAAVDILSERRRQIETEGYDTAHDDEHVNDEIAAYATFYAMPPGARDWPAEETGYGATWGEAIIPENWGPAKPGDRRGELVKAGALIVAEIERLDRAAAPKKEGG